jgi:hypothetical protein
VPHSVLLYLLFFWFKNSLIRPLFAAKKMQFSALVTRSIKSRILVRQIISNHKLTFTVRTLTSQRDAVVFNDGREGWMVEKKGSWYSINVLDPNGQEKVMIQYYLKENVFNKLRTMTVGKSQEKRVQSCFYT